MSPSLRSTLLLVFSLTLLLTPAAAQSVSAALKGSVVDPTNAAMAGVEISLFSNETGAQLRTARRRGAKLYPNKETTVDMTGMNRVFLGWIDMREDDWAAHGYSSKSDWASAVEV